MTSPSADVTIQAPFSSPLSSDHHATPLPSGSTTTASTPTVWWVSCRRTPVAMSSDHACVEPSSSETKYSVSGRVADQDGKPTDVAANRSRQDVVTSPA